MIGIDPGVSGGIAMLYEDGRAVAHKMPLTDNGVLELLRSVTESGTRQCCAVLEHVHAIPGRGFSSSAMFNFGRGYGGLRMALLAAEIPFKEVRAAHWQRAIGCLSKGDKNVTKRKAQELFPTLKITHAIADALLIAEMCRRLHSA